MDEILCSYEGHTYGYNGWNNNGDYAAGSYYAAYAGSNGSQNYACVIKIKTPSFEGTAKSLALNLIVTHGFGTNPSLSYAICKSDSNRDSYMGALGAIEEANQIATDTITFSGLSANTSITTKFEFDLPVPTDSILPDSTYYIMLYLDGDNASGVMIRPQNSAFGSHSVSLKYEVGSSIEASTANIPDVYIGEAYTILIYAESPSLTHSIKYTFGSMSGYIGSDGYVTDLEEILSGNLITFRVPTTFYTQIPNSVSGTCSYILKTYDGENVIGEKEINGTVRIFEPACRPELSVSVRDINSSTLELTGDESVLVRYCSTALVDISETILNSASLSSRIVNGANVTSNSHTILDVSTNTFTVSVVDSRGLKTTKTVTAKFIPYIALTANTTAKRKAPTSSTVMLSFAGNYFVGNFGKADNTISITYTINYPDGTASAAQTIDPIISNNGYRATVTLEDLNYEEAYSVSVTIRDKVKVFNQTIQIPRGVPVFDWGENDFTVNKTLNVKGETHLSSTYIDGTLTLAGDEFLQIDGLSLKSVMCNLFYPVGSLYMSTNDTSPEILFGGTWERIEDRFILAAGEKYNAGATGGSATHTQTIDEMPKHYHNQYVSNLGDNLTEEHGTIEQTPSWIGAIHYDAITYDFERGTPDTMQLGMTASRGGYENEDGTVSTQPMDIMPPYIVAYVWERIK